MENDKSKDTITLVSLSDVRDVLDEIGINSQYYKEDDGSRRLLTKLPADDKFGYDVFVTFDVQGDDNDWLKMQSVALGFDIDDKDVLMAYLIANKYNNYRRYGKLYVDHVIDDGAKKTIYVYEENLLGNQPITIDWLKGNIANFLSSSWDLYSNFIQESRKDFEEMISIQNDGE